MLWPLAVHVTLSATGVPQVRLTDACSYGGVGAAVTTGVGFGVAFDVGFGVAFGEPDGLTLAEADGPVDGLGSAR